MSRQRGGRVPAGVWAIGVVAWLALACSGLPPIEGVAAQVRELTGAHTRIVWVQHDGTDPYAMGENLILMGFDTDDGKGERVIRDERRNYTKPLLTPQGDRLIVSSHPDLEEGAQVYLVDWEGTRFDHLTEGIGLAVWEDPADGTEWVYVGTENTGSESFNFATISRFPIDDPAEREVVWNDPGAKVSFDTFQVSADGRIGGGLFPWPHAGIADLATGTFEKIGEGCWTALASAGTELFWYFDGAHRNVTIVEVGAERRWTVPLNRAPGFDNPEVYHPRWTPHPRFLAISGPYDQGGDNQVRSGGAQAGILLGRFSDDYTEVEAWVRVTDNDGGDAYPDVWIDRDETSVPVRAEGPIGPPEAEGEAAEPEAERLVVEARLVHAEPIPAPRAIAPYRNALVVNGYEIMDILEGSYDESRIQVAQWAIRDVQVLPDARKEPGSVHRLTLEPYDAHPELEGERIIEGTGVSDLPLYYDVEGGDE